MPLDSSDGAWPAPPSDLCAGYGPPAELGIVTDDGLNELSGIEPSVVAPGLLWVHNDSGDGGFIYGIDFDGSKLVSVDLGVVAFDPEDIALGPAPGEVGTYLYLADIGDNFRIRSTITLFRIVEPTVDVGSGDEPIAVDRIDLAYPQRPADAEALAIDPITGDAFVVTKSERGPAVVWRVAFPQLVDGTRITLSEVAKLDLGEPVTAASFSPSGDRLALRSYDRIWLWPRRELDLESVLSVPPCSIPAPPERQGEAIGLLEDGSLVTVSEGRNEIVYRIGSSD